MKSLSRVLGISMLASFAFVGVNSAKAEIYCTNLQDAGIRACTEEYEDCVADNGSSCSPQRVSCIEEVHEEYQECIMKGDPGDPPPPPPLGVAYRQNSMRPALRSILLNSSSPRITVDLRLQ
jgi:hypothetical protein